MQVAASYNKIPGFRRISGYEQYMRMGPGLLMNEPQMIHIIERVTETFPELAEVRQQVIASNPRQ